MSGLDVRAIREDELPRKPFPETHQQFRVFIAEEAFDAATAQGAADLSREVGGILVGDVCRDDLGPYVRVDTTIEALHAEEKDTELTLTHATWEHVHREMDTRHQGKRIVGWYHTHPGFGIFLSDRDEFIQRSFFNLPYQIALVYDPKSRKHGVFAWRDNAIARWRQYWVGRSEHSWDGSRDEQLSKPDGTGEPRPQSELAASQPTAEPTLGFDLQTLAMGGLIILLLGGFLGWWLGGRSASDEVRRARTELSAAQASGAKEAIRLLNLDVLALMRQVLASDGGRRDLDEGVRALRSGIDVLGEAEGTDPETLTTLRTALAGIDAYANRMTRGDQTLRIIEATALRDPFDSQRVARVLVEQAAVLGQLGSVLAARCAEDGKVDEARRLLLLASRVDPGNSERYSRQIAELAGEEEN